MVNNIDLKTEPSNSMTMKVNYTNTHDERMSIKWNRTSLRMCYQGQNDKQNVYKFLTCIIQLSNCIENYIKIAIGYHIT